MKRKPQPPKQQKAKQKADTAKKKKYVLGGVQLKNPNAKKASRPSQQFWAY